MYPSPSDVYPHKSPPPSAPSQWFDHHPPPPQYGHHATGAPAQFVTPSHPPPPQYGQVTTGVPVPNHDVPWSSSLCGCFSDLSNCCITCCCPCITFGQIAEIVDKGNTSCGIHGALYALIMIFSGCGCLYSCIYRSKLRRQYMLQERPCDDCLVHCCCEPCALCQEYRELKRRGFDMSIGWEGNIVKQNQGIPMPPTGMYR